MPGIPGTSAELTQVEVGESVSGRGLVGFFYPSADAHTCSPIGWSSSKASGISMIVGPGSPGASSTPMVSSPGETHSATSSPDARPDRTLSSADFRVRCHHPHMADLLVDRGNPTDDVDEVAAKGRIVGQFHGNARKGNN